MGYPRSRQISALQLSDLTSTHQRPRRHHQESSESETRPSVAWDRELHNGPRKMWTSWTAWLTAVVFTASVRAKTTSHVTCGSVIKLVNTYYDVRLHSHDERYGSSMERPKRTSIHTTSHRRYRTNRRSQPSETKVRATQVTFGRSYVQATPGRAPSQST